MGDGVQNSYALGEAVDGVGAQRHCELAPSGAMRETVAEWVPDEKMVIAIDQIEKMPVNDAAMTFTLADRDEKTSVTMSYDYDPKGGPFSLLVAAMLNRAPVSIATRPPDRQPDARYHQSKIPIRRS